MSIWILTIGSSDVQLDSNSVSQQKGRSPDKYSEKIWRYWYDAIQDDQQLPPGVTPIRNDQNKSDSYRILPRVLGIVYKCSPEHVQQEILSYLTFPLLDSFTKVLKDDPDLHTIVILLTDQSNIMAKDKDSPCWKDTCELEPILRYYFREKFPNTNVEVVILSPISAEKGLDNWDAVFDLVSHHFKTLSLPQAQSDTVFVSHQAGTPALSSAVQFCSLAKFTDRVRFLFSNEYNPENTGFVESSGYLKGIKKEQAKKLLENYDYAGVEQLIGEYLTENARILLSAALQWNYAKFDEFANELAKLSSPDLQELVQQINDRRQHWWWSAYEAAYLALVRLDQKNAVESFFHSFRAVEGLISKWAEIRFPDHIDPNNDSPILKISILDVFPDYLGKKEQDKLRKEFEERKTLVLSGFPLYALLRADRPNWKNECKDFSIFTDKIAPKRNKLFHRLKGLQADKVFQEWEVTSYAEWSNRILKYLNFITEQNFSTLEEASLMSQVHTELQKTIDLL